LLSENNPVNTYPLTHDNFFTSSMSDLRVAREFFQQHLPPDLLQAIALEGIELCKDKFHTPHLKGQTTDMLYSVPLRHHTQCAYIAALVEHQSVPRKNMSLRVLRYQVAVMHRHWVRYKAVPLVYTLVYYNGKARWRYPRDIKALIQAPPELIARYALQPFQLIELNQIPDEKLRRSLWAGVMGLAMKHIFDRDILPALRSFMDLLKVLKNQHAGDDYVVSLLYYLYERGDISDENQFQELIARELPKDIGAKTMTLAQLHRQEGIQLGVQQGVQLGEQSKGRVIARNLLREGLPPVFVAKTTDVEMSVIQEIIAELQSEKI
jgi:recombination-promoting nuclease RpnB